MKISIQSAKDLSRIKTFILFVFKKEDVNKKKSRTPFLNLSATLGSSDLGLNIKNHATQSIESGSISGEKEETVLYRQVSSLLGKNILYLGLGDRESVTIEDYRHTSGKAYSFLKKSKLLSPVSFLFHEGNVILSDKGLQGAQSDRSKNFIFSSLLQAVTEGFYISSYSFDQYKKSDEKKRLKKRSLKGRSSENRVKDLFLGFNENQLRLFFEEKGINFKKLSQESKKTQTLSKGRNSRNRLSREERMSGLSKGVQPSLNKAKILSESIHFVRRVADTPGNLMTPDILSRETLKAARGIRDLSVRVWKKNQIKKERMGGLYGVSLGSDVEPRFIIMEYKGDSTSKKPVCFVGKGLTFDSGGISIKPSQRMHEMKYDMCGGATVIGTLLAIARLRLKVNVLGLIPSSENMPGPMANKPGDILIARNGKSVEVLNTDAEGRLILMDALSYASEKSPQVIFDAATLTGAIVVALGNIYTGVFTRKDELWSQISSAAQKTGERFWRLPLDDFHVKDMKGVHADLSNISSRGGGAGSSTAAAFLESFVKKDIPWAHFDIAGTASSVGNRLGYCPGFGASGSALRTFVALAEEYQ